MMRPSRFFDCSPAVFVPCPQKGFLLLVMEVLMKGSAGMIVDASTYIYSLQPSSYNILVEYG